MATKKAAKKSSANAPAEKAAAKTAAPKKAAAKVTPQPGVRKSTKTAAKPPAKKAADEQTNAKSGATAKKAASSKRELIEPKGDKRLIRRNDKGQIQESDDLGASLSRDVRQPAKKVVKSGQGDRGDQKKKVTGKAK